MLASTRRGLTFVEILVGVALFGGALAVVLGLFPMAYNSLVQARDTTVAIQLARKVLDRARATPFNSLVNITDAQFEGPSSPLAGARFSYELSLSPSQLRPNLYYEATVTVRWDDQGIHSIRLDSVIDNR
jgi:type II secretory pathway pseudopilin PulG